MRELAERLETWVHLAAEPDLDLLEAPLSPGSLKKSMNSTVV